MRYEWDEEKRRANLEKHGLDFADVESGFDWSGTYSFLPDILDHEVRHRDLSWLQDRLVMLIWTQRGETIRLISLRTATRAEKRIYAANT